MLILYEIYVQYSSSSSTLVPTLFSLAVESPSVMCCSCFVHKSYSTLMEFCLEGSYIKEVGFDCLWEGKSNLFDKLKCFMNFVRKASHLDFLGSRCFGSLIYDFPSCFIWRRLECDW